MKHFGRSARATHSSFGILVAGVFGALAAIGALVVGACSDNREGFAANAPGFEPDASNIEECLFQCSLDGRSVIRACDGAVVETCRPELACGAGACQAPCAAAAADKRSNGCEFYMQPPRFTKRKNQSCYATYVVNTSDVPADVTLELQGEKLDVSRSMYRTNPGDPTLIPHTGPIAPGDSVILFVSDEPEDRPPLYNRADSKQCPPGVTPASFADPLPERTGLGWSFHLTTNVPVGLAAIYPFGGATSYVPSATLLLPVATWGKQHILVNAWEAVKIATDAVPGGPAAQIVAAEDGTEITIVPSRDLQRGGEVAGSPAGVPATFRLDKGQLLQLDQTEELSGSVVTSNKPTSIFGGHEGMDIPATRKAQDLALQQLPAFEQWGSEYAAAGYRPRLGNEHEPMPYRIVAARDGTRLDYDPVVPPGAPLEMKAGEVVTFWSGVGDAFVVRTQDADHPIYLAAYMTGGAPFSGTVEDYLGSMGFDGNGDPEFVNVVAGGQYLNAYSFFADPTYGESSLVIIRAKERGVFKDVWLECAGTLTDFKPIGTRGDYEWTRVDLIRAYGPGQAFDGRVCKSGLQRMRSDGPFTATIWGWGAYASYAYPGGMAQRKLVLTPLPLVR